MDEARQRDDDLEAEGRVRGEEACAQREAMERERATWAEERSSMARGREQARLRQAQLEAEVAKLAKLLEISKGEAGALKGERNASIERECSLEEQLNMAVRDAKRSGEALEEAQGRLAEERRGAAQARGEVESMRGAMREGAGGATAEEARGMRAEVERARRELEGEKDRAGRLEVALKAAEQEVVKQVHVHTCRRGLRTRHVRACPSTLYPKPAVLCPKSQSLSPES